MNRDAQSLVFGMAKLSREGTDVSLEEAISAPKRVAISDDAVLTARGMSITFRDE